MKQKKVTECVPGSEQYERAKNGRLVLKCKCAECGITKSKFVKNQGNYMACLRGQAAFLFDVYDSHSVGEVLLKSGLNVAAL